MLYVILLFLLGCFVYKILLNAKNWYFLNKYKNLHKNYLQADDEKTRGELGWEINKKTPEIVKLFKSAGLSDTGFSFMDRAGLGYVQQQRINIFSNLASLNLVGDNSIPHVVVRYFTEGLGVYEMRLKESFSPFYWINVIVFLPREIITYLGLFLDSKWIGFVSRLTNIVYWVFATVYKIWPTAHHYLQHYMLRQ